MMKRIRRTCLFSIALVGLLASVGFAGPGPGGYTDGDPDHPHFMKPVKIQETESQIDLGSAAPGTSRVVASEPSSDRWELVLRAYWALQRFFLL